MNPQSSYPYNQVPPQGQFPMWPTGYGFPAPYNYQFQAGQNPSSPWPPAQYQNNMAFQQGPIGQQYAPYPPQYYYPYPVVNIANPADSATQVNPNFNNQPTPAQSSSPVVTNEEVSELTQKISEVQEVINKADEQIAPVKLTQDEAELAKAETVDLFQKVSMDEPEVVYSQSDDSEFLSNPENQDPLSYFAILEKEIDSSIAPNIAVETLKQTEEKDTTEPISSDIEIQQAQKTEFEFVAPEPVAEVVKPKKYYPSQAKKAKIPVRTQKQEELLSKLQKSVEASENLKKPTSLPVAVRIIKPEITEDKPYLKSINSKQQAPQVSQAEILKSQLPAHLQNIPVTRYFTNLPKDFRPEKNGFSQPEPVNKKTLKPELTFGAENKAKPEIQSQPKLDKKSLNELPEFSLKSKIYVEEKRAKSKDNKPQSLVFNDPKPKKKSKLLKKMAVAVLAISLGAGIAGFQTGLFSKNSQAQPTVAGAQEFKSSQSADLAYSKWITEKLGNFSAEDVDEDKDGLTNLEEYRLDSNPKNPNTCNPSKTDAQNVYDLIDPVSCQPMDLNETSQFEKYSAVINISSIQEQILKSLDTEQSDTSATQSADESFLSIFGVKTYQDLDKISPESLQKEALAKQTSIQYLNTIDRIEKYISKYRSYETQDRNYAVPVHAGKYLEVSIKYKVPLKYVIAIARTESRFGTDRYTKDGNETRISKYKNIYSMGLTDSGSNINYNSWEDGVDAFGKWYKKFNDRGVSDCRKWKIYNPNGDYCTKIENLASEIDAFLKPVL